MRSLVAFLAFIAAQAHAEPPSAKIGTTFQSDSGSAGLSTISPASATTRVVSVDASTGSISSVSTFRLGLDQIYPDYSRYLITDRSGNITPLSSSYSGSQQVARAGIDFFLRKFSFSLDGSQTAGNTPFPGYTGKLASSYEEYSIGAKYSLLLSRSDHSNPESFFVNPDTFQTQERPSRNLENRMALSWEQILSETTKAKIEMTGAERPESRPPFGGIEGSLGWAVTNSSAFIGKLGIAHELRNSPLYDDLGYFDATWGQIEYRIEPNYRWSISAILGTVLETETPRGSIPEQKIGTDSAGIVVHTHGKSWDLGLNALGAFSNTGYQSLQFGGNLTWQI